VDATLGSMDGDTLSARERRGGPADDDALGLTARPLTNQEADQLGVKGGLFVERSAGRAAQAGLQRGDVILAINNAAVTDVKTFRQQLKRAGKRFALLIQRGDGRLYLPIRLK